MDKEQFFNTPEGANRNKYYREHILQYSLLVISFIASVAILFQLKVFIWKVGIVFALSLFYLIFGIWHHLGEKNHTSSHFLEYLLVAAIAFFVLFSIFLG